ncbi:MAG TPA: adenosylmethionine decarboxylase [Steroidobacteraceae bacterium]|nr:adenosylmethionine decarboxylase [Steroidobacteraceae bacterium]
MKAADASVGMHLLADLHGVDADLLQDRVALESLLRRAAEVAGARVLGSHFHSFGVGDGVTGVVLLAESHISIHTWPETGLAAADIFMCGSAVPGRALAVLVDGLAPARHSVRTLSRGVAERNVSPA